VRFKSKIVVVTGAAQGIGNAIARRFAEEGATVVIADLNKDGATTAASAFQRDGLSANAMTVDVSNKASVDALFGEVEKAHGSVDVLVNNAGAASENTFLGLTEPEWRHALGVMLDGTFFCTQAAGRLMKKSGKGGAVVNIASQGARTLRAGRTHYSVAKAGIVQLTQAAAVELAPYKVRVNSVSPGGVATGISRYLLDDPARLERYNQHVPLGRLGQPSEVAAVVAFLASDDASYITATDVDVDGGKHALGSSTRATATS
jgi:NAD(P)-dependent dehydrogenase (short-subunit alcohol dehydrogenase family)